MDTPKIKKIVIAGGGTAGWIAAAALSSQMSELLDIILIESDEIGTVGVGEATIPPMRVFHKLLRIDEQEFMRATSATFKLGISFEEWGGAGDRYLHSFGRIGKSTWLAEFHHFWLRSRELGMRSELGDYCLEYQAANAGKFTTSSGSELNYAYHLDATAYASFLRKISEKRGVKRIEGKIQQVSQHTENGHIQSLILDSGRVVEGDFFIDCTGFRALLIEQALHTGFEDWTHWLPCDSAIAVQTPAVGPSLPVTRAIAHDAGWRWRIPLQHRVGNGLVYCSSHMSDETATSTLLNSLDTEPITTPRVIRFKTGRRRKMWNKNCLALGLASGFLEPLESTSIHLVMMGITRFMQLFPFNGVNEATVTHFNTQSQQELEKTRDFIILHYHAINRSDTLFWQQCKNMVVPDSLTSRIELFRENAHAYQLDGELFRVDSWVQVMIGQGVIPKQYHPIVRTMSENDIKKFMSGLTQFINSSVSALPNHQDFIAQYCSAVTR